MKTSNELLSELRKRGARLWVEDDRLRYRAPEGAMTPELLKQLRTHKAEILAFLQTTGAATTIQRPPLLPVDRTGGLLPSFAQQRLWLLQQFEPDTPANNMPVVVRFTGKLDIPALERSLTEIIRRHEILRTTFPVLDGQTILVIAAPATLSVAVVDLQNLPAEQRDAEAHCRAAQDAKQPFDLVNGPVVWFKLFRLAEQEHLLLWNMHAIVCDGTSADLFYRELTALYAAFSAGQPSPLPDLPIQYADFAQWQRQWLQREVLKSYLNYWKQKLSGNLPPLQLPTDHPRPLGVQTYRGDRYARMLPRQLHHDLMRFSQQLGTTLFVTLLTTFNTLLYRYSQQSELLTTFVSSGRSQVETEALMGFFSNTLVLRTHFEGNLPFRDLLRQVHQSVLEAHTYQDVPFEKLVEELRPEQNQSRSPLYQIKFTLNPPWTNGRGMAAVELPDLTIKALFGYIYNGKTKFDLTLVTREQDEGLGAVFDFNADLFDTSTIERMMGHFQTLLESIVVNPDQCLAELPLLTTTEQQQLLSWNQPPVCSQAVCLHQRFAKQVEQTPNAVALAFEQSLTYRELNHRANQLAHYLQQSGVKPETPVGVCLERSPDLIVALLGILKAGGAYVPLEPDASSDYWSWVVESHLDIVLTETRFEAQIPTDHTKLVCLDRDGQTIAQQPADNPASSVTVENLASIVYPVNPIGRPSGLRLSHRAMVQCAVATAPITLTATETYLYRTALSLPSAAFEIWGSLLNGAKLVVLPHRASLAELGQTIQRHKITSLWLPTQLFHHLVAEQLQCLDSVRQLLTGGAPLAINPVQAFLQSSPHRTLVQMYNLPAHPAWICTQVIAPSILLQNAVPLGRPTATTQVSVLDRYMQSVPVGIPGELYIGGDGVARDAKARLYKTGQRVRWLPEGELELLGADNEMQIQGLPVNLRQVETAIGQHPAIQELYVLALKSEAHVTSLVAYLVLDQQQTAIAAELRSFLKSRLPGHLIPSVFICLESLPLTVDGDVDHSALPTTDLNNQEVAETGSTPEDEIERQLTEIWQKLLGIAAIGTQDNFFDLGGDSLMAVRLFTQIEKTFNKNLPLATLLQSPTIKQLAQVVRQQALAEVWSPLVMIQQGGSKPPLFCVHGGGFNVLIYRDLARNLPPDQPVYGLQARGLAGDNEPIRYRIEAIATDYVKQIKTVQPQGPYFLSGLSNGGNIALEMAQQLRAQGHKVPLLALFDSYTLDSAQLLPPLPRLLSSLAYALRYSTRRFAAKLLSNPQSIFAELQKRLRVSQSISSKSQAASTETSTTQSTASLRNQSSADSNSLNRWMNLISQCILDHSPWSFFTPTAQLSQLQDAQGSMAETFKTLEQLHEKAHKAYVPSPYGGTILLFRAAESPPGFYLDPELGWGKLATGSLLVYEIPGHHTEIMKSLLLAETLRAHLK